MVEQLKNNGLIIGTLVENAIKIEDAQIKGTDIKCKVAKGDISVRTPTGVLKLRVYRNSKNRDGSENTFYKGYETIAKTYVSEADVAKNDELTADVVSCNFNIRVNDYKGQDGQLRTTLNYELNRATRVSDDEEKRAVFQVIGVIKSIRPEMKGEDETGRILVDFVNVTYGSVANPLSMVVGEDIQDDFEDFYAVGDMCELDCELVTTHVGEKKTVKAGIGKKVETRSGYDVTEIVIVGGNEAFDEEYNDFVSKKDLKKLLEERDIMLEEKKNESKQSSKKAEVKNRIGKRKPKVEIDDEDELPFDVADDEDDPF